MIRFLAVPAAGLFLFTTATSLFSDDNFITKASQANLAEVAVAKLAITKSSSDKVKRFAGQMISDHTTAQKELMVLAKKENITLPTQPDSEHRAAADQLSGMSGAAFDSAYMTSQIVDHKTAVTLFTEESTTGTDPEAKAYAGKYLPKLKHHLMMTGMQEGKGTGSHDEMVDSTTR